MIRGACGAVILSTGFSFGFGAYAVIRGRQLVRDVAVATAKSDSADRCNPESFRYSYPEGSSEVGAAVLRCKAKLASSVPPWWIFKSPLETLLFPRI